MIAEDQLLPILETFKGVQQEPSHHAEGDVYEHTCNVLEALENYSDFQSLDDSDTELETK